MSSSVSASTLSRGIADHLVRTINIPALALGGLMPMLDKDLGGCRIPAFPCGLRANQRSAASAVTCAEDHVDFYFAERFVGTRIFG
jgi:hypothetical protein